MSVFRGSVAEYPGVIIDHFVPRNCEIGRAFFLSHCHRDHMSGLGSPNIIRALESRCTSFHCSEVTQALLMKDPEFTGLVPYLKSLPMEEPVAMTLKAFGDLSPLSFTVTLLPAGHCPGSVMFFFQGPGGNVLYTGDFRLTLAETKRLRPLHTSQGLMDITTLYLDTTFCHPIAAAIPSRETSRDKVLEVMERWLANDGQNVIRLHCGTFGYEHILLGVARKFKSKIHIASWKMAAYSEIPAVAECLTADGNSTRIHCCLFKKGEGASCREGLPCGSCPVSEKESMQVLHIKPSTLWFLSVAKSLKEPYVFLRKARSCRVIHSMHASYEELRQFILYLKPLRIVPCVLPVGDSTFTSLQSRLQTLLPGAEIDSSACVSGAGGDPGGAGCKMKSWKSSNEHLHTALKEEADVELLSCPIDDISDTCTSVSDSFRKLLDKKKESFLLPVTSVSRPLLPSMLETRGGVIAPPRSSKGAEVGCTLESLEQTPLVLDSSEDTSSSQSSPVKNLTHHSPELGDPLPTKKLKLSTKCKTTTTWSSVKRRNLTKSVYHHYGNHGLSHPKLINSVERQTLNPDHQCDAIPSNDLHNTNTAIPINDHHDTVSQALEQTPLVLDSSEDTSSSQSSPVKNLTHHSPELGDPLPTKKLKLSTKCKTTTTWSSVKRRNLTKSVYHHYGNHGLSHPKLINSVERQTLNPDHQCDAIPSNDLHNTNTAIPINDHHDTVSQESRQSEERAGSSLEESQGSQSPSILPLTPGKEDVASIFHRQNLSLF